MYFLTNLIHLQSNYPTIEIGDQLMRLLGASKKDATDLKGFFLEGGIMYD